MNVFTRGAAATALAVGAVFLTNCSGGVSVPAAGSTAPATAGPATATPVPTGTTPPATATPVSVSATPTPTPGLQATATPVPTPTPTSPVAPGGNGCPPTFPSPQPVSSDAAWPSGGGTIALPAFADQTGSVVVPTNNAAANTVLVFMESQTPFTDTGGNGNIPTPPSGYTAISYVASFFQKNQTVTFGGTQKINVTAKAPCEIVAGHSYYAFAYANGGGFNHSELSPTTGYPAPMAADGSVSFTIDLSSSGGLQPSGTGLETVFAYK